MPKQTFFNLSMEKRTLIIDTALEEFANNTYDKASLSKIVETAQIAKGSMYQYFNNKEELFYYLIQYASDQKLFYINATLNVVQTDFFKLYKDIIFAAARFDIEFPLYSSFLYSVGKDTHNSTQTKKIMASSVEFIKKLLQDAYSKGQIRKDVNLDFAAFIISYLSVDVGEYIADKYGYSYRTALTSKSRQSPVTDAQLSEVLDELIDFFRRGMAS